MPAVAELIPAEVAPPFALFGKHPAFGDFVARRMDAGLVGRLERWLDTALTQVRDGLGDNWGGVFDNARPLRFWLGSEISGCGPVAGVLVPSRDKVGRRYPLIILAPCPAVPPTLVPDQGLHDHLAAALQAVFATDAAGFPDAVPAGDAADHGADATVLWATNPLTDAVALLTDLCAVDHQRAAQTRSYWWSAPDDTRSAAVFACTGFPDGAALSWLFCGVARATAAPEIVPQQDITSD